MFSFLYHCQYFYQTWLYIWVTRRVSYKKPSRAPEFTPRFFGGVRITHFFYFFVLSYYVSTCWVPWCDVRYHFRIKTMLGSSLPPPVVCMFVWGSSLFYAMSVCLRIVMSNTYCIVFLLVLCFVYPMLPVSLDYPFLLLLLYSMKVYFTVLWIFHLTNWFHFTIWETHIRTLWFCDKDIFQSTVCLRFTQLKTPSVCELRYVVVNYVTVGNSTCTTCKHNDIGG